MDAGRAGMMMSIILHTGTQAVRNRRLSKSLIHKISRFTRRRRVAIAISGHLPDVTAVTVVTLPPEGQRQRAGKKKKEEKEERRKGAVYSPPQSGDRDHGCASRM
jgi:hypothetical protein